MESVESELEKQLRLEKLEEKRRNKVAAADILCFSRKIAATSTLEGTAACALLYVRMLKKKNATQEGQLQER